MRFSHRSLCRLFRAVWPFTRRQSAASSGHRGPRRRSRRTLDLQQLEPRLALSGTTQRLADFPDGLGVAQDSFVTAGGITYFAAGDGEHGIELWKTDGRTVSLVADILPGPANSSPSGLIAVGNAVFFTASDGNGNYRLWKSEGTAESTVQVGNHRTQFSSADDPLRAVLGGQLFFAGQLGADGDELWKTDGSTTTQVSNINANFGSYPSQMAAVGGTLYFAASDYALTGIELWKTDGTTVTQVADIRTGPQGSAPSHFKAVGSTLYFTADNGSNGRELWKTDGTTTVLVSDIRAGVTTSDPQDLTPLGSDLYFAAVDDFGQRRLWKTDGTTTVQVGSEFGLSSVDHLAAIGGQIYFSASSPGFGREVWRTEGSTIEQIGDINPGSGSASPAGFTAYAGAVFFSADDGTTGRELWRIDGTTATRVADIFPDAPGPAQTGSAPAGFAVVGDRLLFSAHDGLRRNLWFYTTKSAPTLIGLTNASVLENASAGTPVGTFVTSDPDVGETVFTYTIVDAGGGVSGDQLGFSILGDTLRTTRPLDRESLPVRELRIRSTDPEGFYTEQTFQITVSNVNEGPNAVSTARRLADIRTGAESSLGGVVRYVQLGGFTYFAADDGVNGTELWKTNGVATWMVADLNPGPGSSDPRSLITVGGRLFFAAATTDDGPVRLWQTDGNAVTQVPNIEIGRYGFSGVEFGGLLYLDGLVPQDEIRTLWRTDGLTASVVANVQATDFEYAIVGDSLYFVGSDSEFGNELWKTNGSTTTRVTDLNPEAANSQPGSFAVLGNTLFFRGFTNAQGYELWKTTGSGAELVRDITPGSAGSQLGGLTVSNGFVYFAANDGQSGIELWRTNGELTERFADINQGNGSSAPVILGAVGTTLYFAADDGVHGTELWKTDGGQAPTLVADINDGPNASFFFPFASVVFGSDLYFRAADDTAGAELWKTDGTTTVRVTDSSVFLTEFGFGGSSWPSDLTVIGNTLYFSAIDDAGGREPWVLSATVAENSPAFTAVATLVTFDPDAGDTFSYVLVPGEGDDDNGDFIIQSGVLLTTRPLDYELGRTRSVRIRVNDEGGLSTETVLTIRLADVNEQPAFVAAPRLLRDIFPGVSSSFPMDFTAAGPFVYFTANDDTHGHELWRTDGITTTLVTDLRPGPAGTRPTSLTALGSTLFFAAATDGGPNRIWKTDGTTTSPAGNLRGGGMYGSFESIALNGWLYLSASESDEDFELWKTDGSTTVRVANINEEPGAGSSISDFRQAGNTLYFTADDGVHGRELWKTTGSGATLVDDIQPGPGSSSPTFFAAAVGDTLYFIANTAAYGYELWKTTGSGATLVRDIRPGPTGCVPGDIVAVDGVIYFTADDGVSGSELWRSDGTALGTTRVTDIWPGTWDASPQNLTVVGNTLFFTADDGVHGRELWKFDGVQAARISDINPGSRSSNPGSLVARGGSLVFGATDDNDRTQLYAYDGSSVMRVTDRIDPFWLIASQDWLVLPAADSIHGAEPWAISSLLPVAENQPAGTVVATFSTADPDGSDSFTYEIVPTDDSFGFVLFTIDGDTLRTVGPLNYEAGPSYSLTIRSTDRGGLSTMSFFTVVVTNVNEAPTSIWTPPLTVPENSATGTSVGGLNTLDADVGDQFTYALVQGIGDTDNGRFTITTGGQIRVAPNAALNFERQSTLSIRVRTTDRGGLSLETPLTIQVTDVDEAPVVDHIVPPANGSYRARQPLRFTAVLTQPVTMTGRGVADVALTVGRAAKKATLVSGLGTNRLTFQYIPAKGDNDLDGVALGSVIRLPKAATLRDGQGRTLATGLPSVATSGILVDNTAPKILSFGLPASRTYRPGDTLLFTAVLSERVTVAGTPTVSLTIGRTKRSATYLSGSGTNTLVFRYVIQAGDLAPKGITITARLGLAGSSIVDAAGNVVAPTFRAPPGKGIVIAPPLAATAMQSAFASLG